MSIDIMSHIISAWKPESTSQGCENSSPLKRGVIIIYKSQLLLVLIAYRDFIRYY